MDVYKMGSVMSMESSFFLEFPWLKKGNQQHASWDNTVMGNIAIDGNLLTIDVNSQERADLIKREIESRLGNQASFRKRSHTVIRKDAGGNRQPPPWCEAGAAAKREAAEAGSSRDVERNVEATLASMAGYINPRPERSNSARGPSRL